MNPDTLKISEDLLAADFSEKQAKALARAIADAQGDLVTKDYFRAELRTELASLKQELIFWMVGLLIVGALVQKFL